MQNIITAVEKYCDLCQKRDDDCGWDPELGDVCDKCLQDYCRMLETLMPECLDPQDPARIAWEASQRGIPSASSRECR
jgi:hypothetical protein